MADPMATSAPTAPNSFNSLVDIKARGNEMFARGSFAEAVALYSQVLVLCSDDKLTKEWPPMEISKVHVNRAAALLKLGDARRALADCMEAITLDINNAKAYNRKATAETDLAMYDAAKETCRTAIALEIEPKQFFTKKLKDTESIANKLSRQDKIDRYVKVNKSIIGCPAKLSLSMFEQEDLIGEGNYSTVIKATFKATKEVFAVKMIERSKVERMSRRHPNIHNEIQMEKKVLFRLDHPNIIPLYHTFGDNSQLYFVSQYGLGGELWAKMRLFDIMVGLPASEARFYAAQLVNALVYLKSQGIAHRDIKPENVILFPQPDINSRIVTLKLIDFGTAKDLKDDSLNGPNFVGTPEYMPPETIRGKAGDEKVDLWALGCVIFQLLSGNVPFRAGSPYLSFLKAEAREFTFPDYFTDAAEELIDDLLQIEPEERIGAKDDDYASIKKHEYFKDIDFEELIRCPRKPLPTLEEQTIQSVGEQCAKKGAPGNRTGRVGPESFGMLSRTKVNRRLRASVMGFLEQRKLLGHEGVFPLFFDSEREARFQRAGGRSFVGFSEQEQAKFKAPFLSVHIGSVGLTATGEEGEEQHNVRALAALTRVVDRLNALVPRPKLVLFTGGIVSKPLGLADINGRAFEALINASAAVDGDDAVEDVTEDAIATTDADTCRSKTIATPEEAAQLAAVARWESVAVQFQDALCALHPALPVMCVPGPHDPTYAYRRLFGDDYYSFFYSGTHFIMLDSTSLLSYEHPPATAVDEDGEVQVEQVLDEHEITAEVADAVQQAAWFDRQLVVGKLCARHCVVVSHHPWFIKTPDEQDESGEKTCLPAAFRERFFNKLQDHNVTLLMSSSAEANAIKSFAAKTDLQPKLVHAGMGDLPIFATSAESGDADDAQFRVSKNTSVDILSDIYRASDLPAWLSLEEERDESEGGSQGGGGRDADLASISDSDSD